MSGSVRSSTTQSNSLGRERCRKLRRHSAADGDLHIVVRRSLPAMPSRVLRRRAQRRAALAPGASTHPALRQHRRPVPLSIWIGFGMKLNAPASNARSRAFLGGNDADGNVPCRQVVLEAVQHTPAVHVGQVDVERDAVGMKSRASVSAAAPWDVTSPLKPLSRAVSSSNRAKARSFSTISTTRSPGRISSRSSSASLTRRGMLGSLSSARSS